MQLADLEVFRDVPFLFWVKDESGRYVWANQAIRQLANEDVVGKTDRELVWSDNAEALQAADERVFATGKPIFLHESVDKSSQGNATLNVCKWLGELDGKKCCFGISFSIE
jgi:PAS domain-containing protein